jgi:hypothetical protein
MLVGGLKPPAPKPAVSAPSPAAAPAQPAHRTCSGAGGLPSHVDDVGALGRQAPRVRHRGRQAVVAAAVAEAVGGDVEDAHDLCPGGRGWVGGNY